MPRISGASVANSLPAEAGPSVHKHWSPLFLFFLLPPGDIVLSARTVLKSIHEPHVLSPAFNHLHVFPSHAITFTMLPGGMDNVDGDMAMTFLMYYTEKEAKPRRSPKAPKEKRQKRSKPKTDTPSVPLKGQRQRKVLFFRVRISLPAFWRRRKPAYVHSQGLPLASQYEDIEMV